MNKIAVAVLCLAFATPAFAQSADTSMTEKTGVNSVLGVAPSTHDFVTEAAISDMFEIESSKLAEDRSDAPTKAFAEEMVTAHSKTSAALQAMVTAGTVTETLPTALDSSHQDMLDKLKGLNGTDFTEQYHSDQVAGHKDAVSLFKRYAKSGDNAALKHWARKTLPIIQHHLQMAEALDK